MGAPLGSLNARKVLLLMSQHKRCLDLSKKVLLTMVFTTVGVQNSAESA